MSIGSELKKAYKKSGLRDIYEKNKKGILGGLAVAGSAGLAAPYLIMKNQADKKKEGIQNAINDQKDAQKTANNDLDRMIGDIRGNPNQPPYVGQPVPSANPALNPGTTGGIVQTGGQASTDQNRLLAEAELQKQMNTEFAGSSKAEREAMLQEYADLISQQQNRILDENAPGIYEDLNTRGLLRSSELGNALGRERGKAASILQEQIGLQGLQDRQAHLSGLAGIQDQYSQGRYGAIQRGMSLEDFARQTEAARLTGQALAPIQQPTPSAKGGSALQGAVGGASAGAQLGPKGALVGGAAGLVGGGLLGSK